MSTSGGVSEILLSGYQYPYGFYGAKKIVNQIGDIKIKTQGLCGNFSNYFYHMYDEDINLEFNFDDYQNHYASYMFAESFIHYPPRLNNFSPNNLDIFWQAFNLKEVRDSDLDTWIKREALSPGSQIFMYCFSLRSISKKFWDFFPRVNYNGAYDCGYNYLCYGCCSLRKAEDLPVVELDNPEEFEWDSESFFYGMLDSCSSLSKITFEHVDKTVNWYNQNLNIQCGYGGYYGYADLDQDEYWGEEYEVTDAESYNRLKNTDNWWTQLEQYSRYNRTSAVETINSLPDTVGPNTITFNGNAGSLTDGGAINTMTEEEIAVATNKGWTVVIV